jgi:hypothetical protein
MLCICLLEEELSVAVSRSFAGPSGDIYVSLSPGNHRPVDLKWHGQISSPSDTEISCSAAGRGLICRCQMISR